MPYNYYEQYMTKFPSDPEEDALKSFAHRYEARIDRSRDKFYQSRQQLPSYGDWNDFSYHAEFKRESMIEVSLPDHKFNELVQRERVIDQLQSDCFYYKAIVDQHRNDEIVRSRNSSVRIAWEHYQMLLNLSK